MFCKECGRNIGESHICPYCHAPQKAVSAQEFIDFDKYKFNSFSKRSKYMAGFMQIFLGCFGIGRFYLGFKKIALLQIAVTLFTLGAGGFIWGVIDGFMIIDGKEKYDGHGKILK